MPPYMCIFLVVNVKSLKLYEPSTFDEENERKALPTIKDLYPNVHVNIVKDTILQKKSKITRYGWKLLPVGVKRTTSRQFQVILQGES
jgi:hypothetical protein